MADDDADLASGELHLVDKVLPPLEAGDYTIEINHEFSVGNNNQVFSSSQAFSVQAPRFRLEARDIHCCSPANNSAGKYDNQLPHIVFNKRTLPWEHGLKDLPGTPWLALLILDQPDLIQPAKDKQGTPHLGTICKLSEAVNIIDGQHRLSNAAANNKLWKPNISALFVGQTEDDPVEVIQLKVDLLQDILAIPAELALLAHAREVSMEHRENMPLDHSGWFSVLVANRFPCNPQTPTVQYAHVVSLEGFEDRLLPIRSTDAGKDVIVQLISLYSWSFTCLPDPGESFGSFMKNLAQPRVNGNGQELLLRLPYQMQSSGGNDSFSSQLGVQIRKFLNSGYVALPYQDANGESSICWYRGPATPVQEAPFTRATQARKFYSAEDAMIQDSVTGFLDLSYSVAWQTGRLMALSNRLFSISLMDWRKKVNHLHWLLLNLSDHNLLSSIDDSDLTLSTTLVSDSFIKYLLSDFTDQLCNGHLNTPISSPGSSDEPQDNNAHNEDDGSAASNLKNLLQIEGVSQILYDLKIHDALPICEFLARCSLLYDVPFERIVPDPELLPIETIRFFYLDQSWIDCMIDGALSVGVQTSKDILHTDQCRDSFRAVVDQLVLQYRKKLLNLPETSQGPTVGTITGFLLRSEVLRQFPGIEVKAYRAIQGEKPDEMSLLTALRMDRLSPTLLLCLFPATPAWIEFDEPHESVCFGITNEEINLRNPKKNGESLTQSFPIKDYKKKQRVLNISGLAEALKSALQLQTKLCSATFALQMVKVTEKLVFNNIPPHQ